MNLQNSPPSSDLSRFFQVIAICALMMAALNLRGGIVVVAPLVMEVRAALNISASEFSMLTTLPLICFGVVSILVPWLSRSFSTQQLAVVGLLLISLGVCLRLVISYPVVLLGTVILGSAIALLNVLIPGMVKTFFPKRIGLMTGLYSIMLSLGAGLGVYLAVPIMTYYDSWRFPVMIWAILPLIGVLFWLPMLKLKKAGKASASARATLWKDPIAWSITLYMGLQSFYFYAIATWLPKIFMESGLDPESAGTAASLINMVSIPFNLMIPILAARMRSQVPLALLVFIASFSGIAGLYWSAASAPYLWASLMGVGAGCSLSLALTLFILRTQNALQATALSAMAQSVGYMIAASGPVMLGAIRDFSVDWQYALLLMMILQVFQLGFGLYASRPGYVKALERH
ncbi:MULTISPECIES: CynX/NimT family MFS transporter [Nitrincola]|uniref:Inner membrane transport protein YeaN n=1 Tax=Nitrincola nitratireducens TaxID=1229521 RepID=W9VRA9_9GAMM|nr:MULTISPECIES: MFS transporter [Nitrincola]EXJ12940.1 Inner membrane transport protein YeaN [Nitrincola nitratireducens]